MRKRHIVTLILLLCTLHAVARTRLVEPQWYTGKSALREAVVSAKGELIDSYSRAGSDTVNVFDTGTTDGDLSIAADIYNYHSEPYASYPMYVIDAYGKKRRVGRERHPVYGWVWGMSDMQHYNAVLMRNIDTESSLYTPYDTEFCVVSVCDDDTTYHVPWQLCHYDNRNSSVVMNRLWLQYSNNTVWIGGGYSADIPWAIVHNVTCYGPLTGLYLGSAAKVGVANVMITVTDKPAPPHTAWRRATLEGHFAGGVNAAIEGFWDVDTEVLHDREMHMGGDYRLAIVAHGGAYNIIYLEGARIYPGRWQEGMVKGRLTPNSIGSYDLEWYDAEQQHITGLYAVQRGNLLTLDFGKYNATLVLTRATDVSNAHEATGADDDVRRATAFVIDPDGYVATSYDAVKDAGSITLYSADSTYRQPLQAHVVIADSINDLAILYITDGYRVPSGILPYAIGARLAHRGEEVSCVGYNMPYADGYSLQSTVGVVTALNGTTASQFTISMTSECRGNGLPLIDKMGNLVGVVSSHFTEGNVLLTSQVAVKTACLVELMQQAGIAATGSVGQTKELSHPVMAGAIAPYIFMVESTR